MLLKPKNKLNTKQERFINFLLEGKYQKEAYMLAGYSSKANTAETNASRLIRNAKVSIEIDNRLEEIKRLNSINMTRISQLAIRRITGLLENDDTNPKVLVEIIKYVIDRADLTSSSSVNDKLSSAENDIVKNMSDGKLNEYIRILLKPIDSEDCLPDSKNK